jgi:EAL domain-containing protein (putative c-di-GMP-specific phosphodiesterase class I)
MAQRLKLQVVAEGVETQSQATFLRTHQCHILQGYLYCRPVDAVDLPAQIQRILAFMRPSGEPLEAVAQS